MVVFFDIDGTLLEESTQTIPESAIRAVEALGRNGHTAVVNTGRPYSHVDREIQEMAFGGWVCGCGSEIRLGDQWISRQSPDEALCRYVAEQAEKWGMLALYEADDGLTLVDDRNARHPIVLQATGLMGIKGIQIASLRNHPQFLKFLTFDGENSNRAEFLKAIDPWFSAIDRGKGMVEYMLKGCSKAEGMKILLKALGVAREDTYAIGDSTNDLPMFQEAAHTICMGNGVEALKKIAEYVTDDVMSDGVEKALQHYGLI